MDLYFAPMEGITGLVCRNAYEACFSGSVEKYFAPFITARTIKEVPRKELRDILPENNHVPYLVPQILANRAEDFIRTAEAVAALGYEEINLNLGCPSKTVVTKKKGAGFLEFPHEVDRFLYEVCDWADKKQVRFSVKTRLGVQDEEEFWELLAIYNKYPLYELILHPRLQSDYYVKPVHAEVFAKAKLQSANPLVYNGDISDDEKLARFAKENPEQEAVMIGRGLLMHPGMGWSAEADSMVEFENRTERYAAKDIKRKKLWRFHDAVYEGYIAHIQGDKNMLFKMKELWSFLCESFDMEDSRVKKCMKQIRKSQSRADYESAVQMLRNFDSYACVREYSAGN